MYGRFVSKDGVFACTLRLVSDHLDILAAWGGLHLLSCCYETRVNAGTEGKHCLSIEESYYV